MTEMIKKRAKEVWAHQGFQRYFKNTGWMFFGRFFSLTISFFVGAYIARYLGPANFGVLNYVISFVGLFGFLSSFGIDGIVTREIVKTQKDKDNIIGTGFFIKIFGSIITIITIFVVSLILTKDIFLLLLIWLFSLSYIPQAFNIIEIYFQSQVASKNVTKAQILSNIIATVLKIFCILSGKGVFWLLSIYVFETIFTSFLLLISYQKSGNDFRKIKFDKILAKYLLKNSWPLMLSSVAIGIYMKIDQVMIKNMLGNEQAGIYAVAVKISEVWYFIPSMICASIFPAIINAKMKNEKLYNDRLLKLYRLMFLLSFFIALPISFLSKNIIMLIFGPAYVEAAQTLSFYVWSGIGVSLGVAISYYLIAENYTKISMITTLLGAFLNVIINILLIPRIGIIGGAVATLLAYFTASFSIVFFKKTRNQVLLIFRSLLPVKTN